MSIDLRLDPVHQNFAVFGNPVKHSKSPQIHSLFARQTGIELSYQAIEVPEDRFSEYVSEFLSQSGKGLNITVPFKEEAFALCTVLTERAENAGSVNVIWFDKESNICGDTTDGKGLINDLTINHKVNLTDQSLLILGAGGSARAILQPLCNQEPKQIVLANRTLEKAEQLATKLADKIKIQASSFENLSNHSFDIIINATSLSLSGRLPPLPDNILKDNACCYDLMYSDTDTVFMEWARNQGATVVLDGIGMLVEQAAESFLIWHGVKPDTAPVIKSLRQ